MLGPEFNSYLSIKYHVFNPSTQKINLCYMRPFVKNKQKFTEIPFGCCFKDPCLGAILFGLFCIWGLPYSLQKLPWSMGIMEGRKMRGEGDRWRTLCLVPTRFCIPSFTIKSPRTSTKYCNSDVDFPEQEEWFLRHTRYSAKLILFFFNESVISRQYIFRLTIVYCSDDERATVLPPHCKWEIWKHLVHHNDTQEERGLGTNRKTKWMLLLAG